MRQEGSIKEDLQAKLQFGSGARYNKGKGKKGNYGSYEATTARNNVVATNNNKEGKFLLVNIVGGEIIHTPSVGENLR